MAQAFERDGRGPNAAPPPSAGAAGASLGELPTWRLEDLYPGPASPALEKDVAKAVAAAAAIRARYMGKLAALGADGARLAAAIAEFEALSDTMGRLSAYADLLYAADTADPERAKFFGDMQDRINGISTEIVFFKLELNQIDDDVLATALSVPALARYAPWLEGLRIERPHQLDERTERLFIEKSASGSEAWTRLFNETMTSLRFRVSGEPGELAIEPTLNLLFSPVRRKRQAAAKAIADVLGRNRRLFTLVTNTLAKDKDVYDRWHGFEDVAARRHLENRVEAPVVEALVAAVQEALPRLSHRYYATKARWLGLRRLAHWDRNAPLPERPDGVVAWADARRIVLDAYQAFSPEIAGIARGFFEKNWIDAPQRDGKSPGAFAHPTVPSAHPYLLLNYQGTQRDVMTLAHELGHGIHQVLANGQGPLMAPTPLTLAETASVFGEMLTFKSLLAQSGSAAERKVLLASKVEGMINTVVRQIAFYTFERRVHEERRRGELTSEQICAAWLDVQRASLGPSVDLRSGYEMFWAYIPHFIHTPFYVYAYAFGDCLVNSLYALYEEAHPDFVAKYVAMLAAGGSKHHSKLLAPFGLDAADRGFWAKGIKVLETMVDELETL